MTTLQRNYVIAGVTILIIAVGVYFIVQKRAAGNEPMATSSAMSSTSIPFAVPANADSVTVNGQGYTVSLVSDSALPPAPDFTTPLTFSADIDASLRDSLNSQFAVVTGQLAKDPKNFDALIGLAMVHHSAGDDAGAVVIWKYTGALFPTNQVTFANLGYYYLGIKDYANAEANYLQAQKNAPSNLDIYRNLFRMYTTTSYKAGTTAGEDILKKGIAANPSAIDLQVMLAQYYQSLGRTAEAKAQFDAAIANAKSQGFTDEAAQLQTEENSL